MKSFFQKYWLTLFICLLIPFASGGLSILFCAPSSPVKVYTALSKPPFAPPAWVFPVVWSILYLLMGISSFLILKSASPAGPDALFQYGVQLFAAFCWPLLFFRFSAFFAALVWLVFLWILVFHLIRQFYLINKWAAWLLIPYLTWISFAGYLNFAVYLLNR